MMLQWLTNFTGLHLCLNICGQPRSLQERSHVRSHSMPATSELNISPRVSQPAKVNVHAQIVDTNFILDISSEFYECVLKANCIMQHHADTTEVICMVCCGKSAVP